MEFATGGDMFQLVVANRGLPEQDARWYFQQLIIAVDYCHRMVQFALHPTFAYLSLHAQRNILLRFSYSGERSERHGHLGIRWSDPI